MSAIGEIRATLDAMGLEQQLCVFLFLMSYPLTLGAMLEARGRRVAAGVAGVSALAFTVFTDPWMHAVLLVVGGVGAVGVFIAFVYLADHAWRRFCVVPDTEILLEGLDAAAPAAETPAAPVRERLPLSPAAPAET